MWFVPLLFLLLRGVDCIGDIIFAVNAGGDSHIDINGIHYQRDPSKVGTASDFGKNLVVSRVPALDQVLYQTERYHHASFGYDIPVRTEGKYVIVLKFCEVYFNAPNMKVFDVLINGEVTVVSELDIYDRVGRGVAHDEYIPFSIFNGKLHIADSELPFDGKLRLDFVKGYRDNPKVNAIYVMKGSIDDVPKLAAIPTDQENESFREESESDKKPSKNRRPSGPRTPDPYSLEDSSIMFPVFVAIGAFVPLLFCLCKL